MRKTRRLLLAGLALLCILALAWALLSHGRSQGVLYRVSGGQADMYILGSIHVGSREMYPMGAAIREAIDQAETFVFECDTQSAEAQAEMEALLYYGEGESLSEHISPECYERLGQVAQKLGYRMDALDCVKPWGVTSMLSSSVTAAEMGERNAQRATALGVESMVRKEASGRPVIYLETAQQQLILLDGFSPALQEYLLEGACRAILEPDQLSAAEQDTRLWPAWWAKGDAQAFANSYQKGLNEEREPLLAREYHDALITRRNQSMAAQLDALLQKGERCFVTVGLMHLVLPGDSILSQLTALGYTVEQIQN